ncbi:MAG: transporter substrate-binding protein [Pseudomonas sp.]|nr:transporter substrate-binding protein [Pseudomonas sp.]
MRFVPGLILVSALTSPLAHAELIDEVSDRGELRIALEGEQAPYHFTQDGKLSGFEVELGEMLAEELDLHADFITTDEADLMQGVEGDKYDMALDQIAVTPELKQHMDFSEPYSYSRTLPTQAFAIPFQKGNPAFQGQLDRALERIRADGRLSALSEKWLGVDTSKPPKE